MAKKTRKIHNTKNTRKISGKTYYRTDYNTKLKSRANKKAKELRAKGNNVVIIKERKRNMLGAYSKGFNYVLYKRKK